MFSFNSAPFVVETSARRAFDYVPPLGLEPLQTQPLLLLATAGEVRAHRVP